MRFVIEVCFAMALLMMVLQRVTSRDADGLDVTAFALIVLGIVLGFGWAVVDAWGWVFA